MAPLPTDEAEFEARAGALRERGGRLRILPGLSFDAKCRALHNAEVVFDHDEDDYREVEERGPEFLEVIAAACDARYNARLGRPAHAPVVFSEPSVFEVAVRRPKLPAALIRGRTREARCGVGKQTGSRRESRAGPDDSDGDSDPPGGAGAPPARREAAGRKR